LLVRPDAHVALHDGALADDRVVANDSTLKHDCTAPHVALLAHDGAAELHAFADVRIAPHHGALHFGMPVDDGVVADDSRPDHLGAAADASILAHQHRPDDLGLSREDGPAHTPHLVQY